MAGGQRLPPLGHLQDALPEECHAGPSIVLALQESLNLSLFVEDQSDQNT
jgi:hypothetical protein